MDLETQYQHFLRQQPEPDSFWLQRIDYLGLNIGEDGQGYFKAYYTQDSRMLIRDPLYDFLRDRNMIRYYETVQDGREPGPARMEYRLGNRNNGNMEQLFFLLRAESTLSAAQLALAEDLARMKVTDRPGCDLAALYFLSVQGREMPASRRKPRIRKAKFHYCCRYGSDPETPGAGEYRDEEFLEFVRSRAVPQLSAAADEARILLEEDAAHLWMVGYDASERGDKYKIYLKLPETLLKNFPERICPRLSGQLREARDFFLGRQELFFRGAALCRNQKNRVSVNLYFTRR